jgi:hypothetical protein
MHWFNMDTSQRAWSRVTDANGQVHRLDGDMDSIPDATKIIHALRAIIACYGVGTRDKAKLLENLGHYILEAKTILDGIEGHDPRWWTAHLPPFDTL